MVFSSHLFVYYFLPIALALYYTAPRRARHFVLVVLSYAFYGWTNPAFMGLLLLSTVIDYVAGLVMADGWQLGHSDEPVLLDPEGSRSRRQRLALLTSLCANLGLLGFFKYFNFATDNLNAVSAALGIDAIRFDSTLRVALPLGISFYTFQSMSYTIDVYRGRARALRSFIDFACFVSMFPQLVAGPIIRFSEVADQLKSRRHSLERFARGVSFFAFGMAKKILLANPCGKIADTVFGAGSTHQLDAWYGATAYAFQIYFDFSGYSDMAIGLGLMFGFVFAKNFDSPYQSQSITEFWQRWHISLSTWLRDYLYLPLGGNRRGARRTYLNLALVMLIGGLWHGAAWNFVAWGAFHGLLLVGERALGKRSPWAFLPSPLRVALTFALVLISWVFFRASDLTTAIRYLASMAGLATAMPAAQLIGGIVYQPYYVLTFLVAALVVWSCPQTWDFTRRLTMPRALLALSLLWLALIALTTQSFNPFIYFIF